MKWLRNVDALLRDRQTTEERLAEGTSHLSLLSYLPAALLGGITYGLLMGIYAVVHRDPPCYMQLVAATLKTPLVFLLTLVVTFPSLYVFSALRDTRLSFMDMLRVMVCMTAVQTIVLASLGPITAFFVLTTESYPFMKLLNVFFFAVSAILGIVFLVRTINRMTAADAEKAPPQVSQDDPPSAAAADVPPPIPPRPGSRSVAPFADPSSAIKVNVRLWLVMYALVGAQMAWILRPIIGDPSLPFAWFRERSGNFFSDLHRTLIELF